MESLELESLLLSVPSYISARGQSVWYTSKHLRAASGPWGLPGAAAGLAMAVLLPGVMQPLGHGCLCSHKLITASAQFTTGAATEILAGGTF